MILEDYGREAVLERLLRYERRIEGSLFRNLNELRRVHDQGCKADQEAGNTLARWREEDDQARKARAFAPWRPADSASPRDGIAINTAPFELPQPGESPSWADTRPAADAPAGDEMCETNPTEVSSVKWEVSSEGRQAASPPGLPTSNFPPETAAKPQLCETNPIRPESDVCQVPCGTAVMNDSAPEALRKTNPICGGVSRLKCEVSSEEGPAPGPPSLRTLNFTLETAAEPQSCETNPICGGVSSLKCEVSSEQGQLCETRRLRQKSPNRIPTRVSERISRIGSADPDFCRARQTNPIVEGIGVQGSGISSRKPDPRPLTPELSLGRRG